MAKATPIINHNPLYYPPLRSHSNPLLDLRSWKKKDEQLPKLKRRKTIGDTIIRYTERKEKEQEKNESERNLFLGYLSKTYQSLRKKSKNKTVTQMHNIQEDAPQRAQSCIF